jgi:L-malate glycosyltransferase
MTRPYRPLVDLPPATDPPAYGRWRHVLIGDGESPHLLKWARALAPQVDLWVASSRGFLPGFDDLVPPRGRLALGETMDTRVATSACCGACRNSAAGCRRWMPTGSIPTT